MTFLLESENADIGHGKVESFRSCGRHDMRGITREKEPAILHWLSDKAVHLRDALLNHASFD